MALWPGVRLDQLPGKLPQTGLSAGAKTVDCPQFVEAALRCLKVESLTEDCLWRDWMVFSDQVRTRAGPEVIAGVWTLLAREIRPHSFKAEPVTIVSFSARQSWVDVAFTFKATQDALPIGCSGRASLVEDGSSWKIWSLTTILEGFHGHQNPDIWNEASVFQGTLQGGVYSSAEASDSADESYEAAITGGGQAGICASARLATLGIPNIVIEKNDTVGAAWSQRYDSLKLHTTKAANQLPFDSTFRPRDPEYMIASDVGRSHERYAKKFGLNMMLSSRVVSCEKDQARGKWHVVVETNGRSKTRMSVRHLILSLGFITSTPFTPDIEARSSFKGRVVHAHDWKNATGMSGKQAVVIGSGNNAHDICVDLADEGVASVTMVQRNRTSVFPIEVYQQMDEAISKGMSIEAADRLSAKALKHGATMMDDTIRNWIRTHPRKHDALDQVGFKTDRHRALMDLFLQSAGKFYVDVGASGRIIKGDIKVKSGVAISRFTETGLLFVDGTELPADLIVFATGYSYNDNNAVAEVVGKEIASKIGPWFGLNTEGEIRGVLKQEYPGLWRYAGGLLQVRFWSRFIALRIQAEMLARMKHAPDELKSVN